MNTYKQDRIRLLNQFLREGRRDLYAMIERFKVLQQTTRKNPKDWEAYTILPEAINCQKAFLKNTEEELYLLRKN